MRLPDFHSLAKRKVILQLETVYSLCELPRKASLLIILVKFISYVDPGYEVVAKFT